MEKLRLTEEEIKKRLEKLGHVEISIDYSTYRGVNKKCRFIDCDYGEWWALPTNVLRNGSIHPERYNKIRSKNLITPIEIIKKKTKETFGEIVTIDESTYINGKTKARFIDVDYGEFWIRPDQIKYVHGHPLRGRKVIGESLSHTYEEAKKLIHEKWGEEVQLVDYRGYNGKSLFCHKIYGEWEAVFANVIKGHSHPLAGIEKYKKTMKRLYGAEHPSQSAEIHLRIVAGREFSIPVTHWKTGEIVLCTASYEFAVVNELNKQKRDYLWQIKFDLGDFDGVKRAYFCDLYLPDVDMYIEIKGRFINSLSLQKWERFHERYPNSELWTLPQIAAFTGKTAYHLGRDFKKALKNEQIGLTT